MSKRPVVTLDGLAACGKSSLAREVALRLGFVHLSTGLLYRALGWLALQEGVSPDDSGALAKLAARHALELSLDEKGASVARIDGVVRSPELMVESVSTAASCVARFPEVREALYRAQREAYPDRGIVAEGRDMGTVVFPDAHMKFFIDARVDVRAARRYAQLAGQEGVTLDAIRRELEKRDHLDSTRAAAPTVAAPDAVHVDNSDRGFEEVVGEMVGMARERLKLLR